MRGHSASLGVGPAGEGKGGGGESKGGGGEGKVLILGAGWMGSRVAAALRKQGGEVEVTHRPRTNLEAKDPYFRPVDLPASVRPCHGRDSAFDFPASVAPMLSASVPRQGFCFRPLRLGHTYAFGIPA